MGSGGEEVSFLFRTGDSRASPPPPDMHGFVVHCRAIRRHRPCGSPLLFVGQTEAFHFCSFKHQGPSGEAGRS
jgi:hypothetical protein